MSSPKAKIGAKGTAETRAVPESTKVDYLCTDEANHFINFGANKGGKMKMLKFLEGIGLVVIADKKNERIEIHHGNEKDDYPTLLYPERYCNNLEELEEDFYWLTGVLNSEIPKEFDFKKLLEELKTKLQN